MTTTNHGSPIPTTPPAEDATPTGYVECDKCGERYVIGAWIPGEVHDCGGHFRLELRPPSSPASATPTPEKMLCDRCDGCGWYEGGKHALQTTCEECGGTGVVAPPSVGAATPAHKHDSDGVHGECEGCAAGEAGAQEEPRFDGETSGPAPIGYYVWTETGGYAFKNKLHASPAEAQRALAGVVWHNRHQYTVRPVYLGATSSPRTPEPSG